MMKRLAIILLGAAGLGLGQVASAADMPVKAPASAAYYNWSGFYVGANAGGAWGQPGGSITALSAGLVGEPDAALPANYGIKSSGAFGGIQAGYNYQIRNIVLGIEADIQGGKVSGSSNSSFPGAGLFAASVNGADSKMTEFGTVRGRVGVTFDRALLYMTGGLAVANVRHTVFNNFSTPVNLLGDTSETKTGWALGAGVEYAINDKLTLKAEYLRLDLGSTGVTATDPVNFPNGFVTYSFRNRYDVARVGLNYRF